MRSVPQGLMFCWCRGPGDFRGDERAVVRSLALHRAGIPVVLGDPAISVRLSCYDKLARPPSLPRVSVSRVLSPSPLSVFTESSVQPPRSQTALAT